MAVNDWTKMEYTTGAMPESMRAKIIIPPEAFHGPHLPSCYWCLGHGYQVSSVALPCTRCGRYTCQRHQDAQVCPGCRRWQPPEGMRTVAARVVARDGRLVKLWGFPYAWVAEARLGPCRDCGCPFFLVIERAPNYHGLRCAGCCGPARSKGEQARGCIDLSGIKGRTGRAALALERQGPLG